MNKNSKYQNQKVLVMDYTCGHCCLVFTHCFCPLLKAFPSFSSFKLVGKALQSFGPFTEKAD